MSPLSLLHMTIGFVNKASVAQLVEHRTEDSGEWVQVLSEAHFGESFR